MILTQRGKTTVQRTKSVDDYLKKCDNWSVELTRLRDILVKSGLTEEVKWGMPCYTSSGKNVVSLVGFKSYFGLWFHQGASLKDVDGVLINAQEGKTKALRQWRMTSRQDIRTAIIKRYLKEAAALG